MWHPAHLCQRGLEREMTQIPLSSSSSPSICLLTAPAMAACLSPGRVPTGRKRQRPATGRRRAGHWEGAPAMGRRRRRPSHGEATLTGSRGGRSGSVQGGAGHVRLGEGPSAFGQVAELVIDVEEMRLRRILLAMWDVIAVPRSAAAGSCSLSTSSAGRSAPTQPRPREEGASDLGRGRRAQEMGRWPDLQAPAFGLRLKTTLTCGSYMSVGEGSCKQGHGRNFAR
jgi:hypothetical protein